MNKAPIEPVAPPPPETNSITPPDAEATVSSPANIEAAWQDNPLYFQTGKKAGTLKPVKAAKALEFSGLDLDALKSTPQAPGETVAPAATAQDKKTAKAEKKSSDARVGAKLVMRILDSLTKWISGGTYGANFTAEQRKDRNKYAEELENDWREYLLTLDIPLHPALVVLFGSTLYVGEAFNTERGKERAQTWQDKIVSKVAVGIFRGAKK